MERKRILGGRKGTSSLWGRTRKTLGTEKKGEINSGSQSPQDGGTGSTSFPPRNQGKGGEVSGRERPVKREAVVRGEEGVTYWGGGSSRGEGVRQREEYMPIEKKR